jgi:hypothetical protein
MSGSGGYNDKHVNTQIVDLNTLRDWWESLKTLMQWIKSRATVLFVKGLLIYYAIETSLGCQGVWCFTMAFRIVNSLRMPAVRATFAACPAARQRS